MTFLVLALIAVSVGTTVSAIAAVGYASDMLPLGRSIITGKSLRNTGRPVATEEDFATRAYRQAQENQRKTDCPVCRAGGDCGG